MANNLPTSNVTSSTEVKQFFDKSFTKEIAFPSNQIDAVVGFFLKNGFDLESARSTSIILLNQSKIDNVDVFHLIDTLKQLTDVQLSQVVAQVLNSYREKSSLLGYRIELNVNPYDTRNILI
jgi:hypothetical protein